jgi:hemerythrin
MAFMDWSPALAIGVPTMDAQHQRLVALINDLHEAMKSRQAKDELKRVLAGLADYTRTHFVAEEALLDRAGYAGLATQRRSHDAITKKLDELRAKHEAGTLFVSTETMTFLEDWLQTHILREDRAYAPHVGA